MTPQFSSLPILPHYHSHTNVSPNEGIGIGNRDKNVPKSVGVERAGETSHIAASNRELG